VGWGGGGGGGGLSAICQAATTFYETVFESLGRGTVIVSYPVLQWHWLHFPPVVKPRLPLKEATF